MATPTNHWKLGLFVVVGLVIAMGSIAVLGARSMREEVGHYVTYFDESVQGLDVGSPIKFRGVTIGTVGRIEVAPDHRLVEVTLDLAVAELSRLGLDVATGPVVRGAGKTLHQDTDLRVQLASMGLTGVKFLQLDFFVVADNPEPPLPFAAPRNYIPAAASTMKSLEEAVVRTANRLPELADQLSQVLTSLDAIAADWNDKRLPEHVVVTLGAADRVLGKTGSAIGKLENASEKAEQLLVSLDETVTRTNKMLVKVDSERGLLASVGRASDAVGDTVRNADGLGGELEDTLRAVHDAAKSVHKLADALEKDPDMLLKGRARDGAKDGAR